MAFFFFFFLYPEKFSKKKYLNRCGENLSIFSGKMGLLNLEKHFAFYGAYHSNPINIAIHMLLVWPIFFTALLILYFTPSFFNLPQIQISIFGSHFFLILNFGFLLTIIYSVFYICLEVKAGSLAALLCILCWVTSSFLAQSLGFSLAWKVQFYFHFSIFSFLTLFCGIHQKIEIEIILCALKWGFSNCYEIESYNRTYCDLVVYPCDMINDRLI